MGTVDASMIACRTRSMSRPVERSITVSAPYCTARRSFSSSSPMPELTAELPMFALILTRATLPMAIGSRRPARWRTLAGITRRPRATSSRIVVAGTSSRAATSSMAGVTSPMRARRICVTQSLIVSTPYAGTNRIRFNGSLSARAQWRGGHPGRRTSKQMPPYEGKGSDEKGERRESRRCGLSFLLSPFSSSPPHLLHRRKPVLFPPDVRVVLRRALVQLEAAVDGEGLHALAQAEPLLLRHLGEAARDLQVLPQDAQRVDAH